jgi:hypothetical protein
MIRVLRRSRSLAVALVLVTPALGGAWLQALHPCPVDAPWVGASAGHEAEHSDGHHGTPAGPAEGCHCVGSCSTATGAVLTKTTESPALIASAPAARPTFPARADPPALRPSDLLPPATAPPLG